MAARRVVGLDIGTQNVKVALLRRSRENAELCDFVAAEFPEEIGDDARERERFAIDTLRHFLRKNGIKRAPAYCCLPTGAMGESMLRLPPMTGKELKQAVRMHLKKKLGNAEESFAFDFRVLPDGSGENNGTVLVQLAVVPREMPQTLWRTAGEAALQVEGISIWGGAIENLIRATGVGSGKCVAVLEIGAAKGAIGVFRDEHLCFAREIHSGGEAFTKALTAMPIQAAGGQFLDTSSAERMKRRHGILVDGDDAELEEEKAARFSAMLRPQLERLVVEVKRSVEYHKQSFRSDEVETLYLCGGGARLKNLAACLSEQLGMPVAELPVNDCVHLASESLREQFKSEATVLATAVGTALSDGKGMNLLPRAVRLDKTVAKARNWLQIVIIASLLLMLHSRQQSRKELSSLQSSIGMGKQALQLLQGGLDKLETADRLRQKLSSLQKDLADRSSRKPHWIGVLKEMSNIIPEDIELSEWVWGADSNDKNMTLRGRVLEQTAAKNLAISEFVLRLEGSPFFKDARLLPARTPDNEKKGTFEIGCVLEY
jgi:type IV pilus assembly protein PilM